jgi:uncharacterized FlaG/YvyC family protein
MSEKAINAIASGAAPAVRPVLFRSDAAGGKATPSGGNSSPMQAAAARAEALDRLVESLNNKSQSIGRAIRFRVDPESTTPIIQVFDRDTGRLIRQIPSDQAALLVNNQQTLDLGRVIDVV